MRSYKLYLLILLTATLSFACERDTVEPNDEDGTTDEISEYVEEEVDITWDSISSTKIELLGDDVQISGAGALFEDEQITIYEGGEFLVTGDLDIGKIKIDADEQDTVKLILNNVSITSNNNACIYSKTADNLIIILADESVNILADNSVYTSDDQNAVIFSKTDLLIAGKGLLKIEANYKDGIASKDGLILYSGDYEIDAIDDGIRGKDYLVIEDGNYTINSGGDAIKSDNEDDRAGTITIITGIFNILTNADGIAAENDLSIYGGAFTIETYSNGYDISAKALKAGNMLYIDSGDFILDSGDDAIHSNNDIIINDGSFTIDTDDDAIHADNSIEIETAIINVNSSLEGIEAGYITVNDGTIVINASDDGFSATQGSDIMSHDGSQLTINGGNITVNMSGNDVDAMDSNGDITINRGTVNLNTPAQGHSEALDANGTIKISSDATVYKNGVIYN